MSASIYPQPRWNLGVARNVNKEHHEGLSVQERIGMKLGGLMGTMWAFYVLVAWNFGWMVWQTWFAPKPFDPYPFAFMLFCSNIVQLLWLPILNVTANVLNKHSELRAEADFEVNKKAEQEIEELQQLIKELHIKFDLHASTGKQRKAA